MTQPQVNVWIAGALRHPQFKHWPRLRLIWRRTLDPRPLFTPNRSVGRTIPDYFGADQWCWTCVSKNSNHFLPITSKESQLAIQFFHYRLPLCPMQLGAVSREYIVAKSNKFPFPMILVWDRKRVNVARYSVEDHLIGWWFGLLSLGDKRSDVWESIRGWLDEAFSLNFRGSDIRLECPVWGGPDVQWSEKAPLCSLVTFINLQTAWRTKIAFNVKCSLCL